MRYFLLLLALVVVTVMGVLGKRGDTFSGFGILNLACLSTSPASNSMVVPSGKMKNVALPDPVLIWWISKFPSCHVDRLGS